ncbi:hypothetical protein AbraIFM66950_004700 [Aspergillus brasiliensis]|nr:hypothetical protein AbraIFM66950_004700 [Aspergillus brasiliensis]
MGPKFLLRMVKTRMNKQPGLRYSSRSSSRTIPRLEYSTTVSPTPISTSKLVLPPRDYFGPTDCYNFPDDFVFGVAGSTAQVEGTVALEGRSPTILEKLVGSDQPKNYVTNENYYLYKQDIERLAAMGFKYYNFSIPWTHILPFVLPGSPVNEQGIKHYDDSSTPSSMPACSPS